MKMTLDTKLSKVKKLKTVAFKYMKALESGKLRVEEEREIRFELDQITEQIYTIVNAPEK